MRLLLLLSLFLSIHSLSFAQNHWLGLVWHQDSSLEWNDFQGEEDKELSLSALSKIAIPYSFSSDGEVDLKISLTTVFVREESWYKKGKENKILLAHEQLHFDIAEVNRRLIIIELLKTKFSADNYEEQIKQIITNIWNSSYQEMQDQYDEETNYSRLFRPQIKWNKFIENKLKSLEEYNRSEIIVNFE